MVGVFKIDGVEISTPSSFEPSFEDISSARTGRTMDGVMHKDVIAVKASYDCAWNLLNWEECAKLLNAVDGKEKVKFTHPDPRVPNQFITKEFYVGARKAPALILVEGRERWVGTAMTFIEI